MNQAIVGNILDSGTTGFIRLGDTAMVRC